MHQWSTTPANNGSADARAYLVEGSTTVAGLNNAQRGAMATAALWRDDNLGAALVATLGANNVYSVATGQGLVDPATQVGGATPAITKPFSLRLTFDKPLSGSATNVPRLTVDGVDCGPILRRDGSALADGDLIKGPPFLLLGDMAASTDAKVTRVRVLERASSEITALIAAGSVAPRLQRVAIRDVKAAGVGGGYFAAGDWRTRDLTQITDDPGGVVGSTTPWVTLDTTLNRFTLLAGIYAFEITCPAVTVGVHRARLQDVTNGVSIRYSKTLNETDSLSTTGDAVETVVTVKGVMTLAATTTFEVQHRGRLSSTIGSNGNTTGDYGFGSPSNAFGIPAPNETYTEVFLEKLSA